MAELLDPPTTPTIPVYTSAYALIDEISRFLRDYFRGSYEEEKHVNINLSICISIDGVALFFKQCFYAVMGKEMIEFKTRLIGDSLYFGLFFYTACLTAEQISEMQANARATGFELTIHPDHVYISIKGTPYIHFGAQSTSFVYDMFVRFFSPKGRFTMPTDAD